MEEPVRIYFQDQWPEIATSCWGCGRDNEHGLQIKSYWEGDEAICEWKAKDYHMVFPGTVSAGIIASILECHCGNTAIASIYKDEGRELGQEPFPRIVTGTLTVKYLFPTPIRKPITLRAKVKESTGKKIIVTCSVFSRKKLCATGEVIAIRVGQ